MKQVSNRTLVFFILSALSLALLILSSTDSLAPVESAVAGLARPFLQVGSILGRQTENLLATLQELASLRSDNRQLKTRVDTLTIENVRLREIEVENARLRELLRFRQLNPFYDFRGGQVIARVISRSPNNYLASLSIDLGDAHGIKPGMPVVTERGLVGRIHRVWANSATVLLITDPSSGIQALTLRSRAAGVVTGRAGSTPIMEYIPQDADIAVGDEVITSGLGGTFPKNLVIGQVVAVTKRDFDMFQQAELRPTVNIDRLEFVLVIMNFQPLPGQPAELDSVG